MNKIMELIKKGPMPTPGMMIARLLVGGYLIYLSKSLLGGRDDSSMNPLILFAFTIIFVLVGLVLCLKAIISLSIGYYKGGKLDKDESEDSGEVKDHQEDKDDATKEEYASVAKPEIIDVDKSEIEELDK